MITRSQSPPLTYQDLLRLPEDLLRHELIDGEHFMSPAPALKHQRIVLNLGRILSTFVRAHRLGAALVAPGGVLFSGRARARPHGLDGSAPHRGPPRAPAAAGRPDLVAA